MISIQLTEEKVQGHVPLHPPTRRPFSPSPNGAAGGARWPLASEVNKLISSRFLFGFGGF